MLNVLALACTLSSLISQSSYSGRHGVDPVFPETTCSALSSIHTNTWISTLTKLFLATQPQRLDPWFFQVLKVQDLEPGILLPSSELRTVARQKSRISNFFIWGMFYHAFCLVWKIHTRVWIFVLILPDFPFLNMFNTTYTVWYVFIVDILKSYNYNKFHIFATEIVCVGWEEGRNFRPDVVAEQFPLAISHSSFSLFLFVWLILSCPHAL